MLNKQKSTIQCAATCSPPTRTRRDYSRLSSHCKTLGAGYAHNLSAAKRIWKELNDMGRTTMSET